MKRTKLFLVPAIAGVVGLVALNHDYVPSFSAANSSVRADSKTPQIARKEEERAEYDVAQSVPSTDSSRPRTDAGDAKPSPQVDETALRYFARQGDTRRLEAEIARLRILYPNWTPPVDPTAVAPQTDIALDAMWKLYSVSKFSEVRKAIREKQTAQPGWVPPADLTTRLELAESREQLVNASDLKQYDTVIRIGSSNNSLLTCSDVDVLWRVGEAFAQTKRTTRAKDAYGYILDNCTKPEERLATVQKALALLDRNDFDALLDREKPKSGGGMEFDAIRDDLARKAVSDAGGDAKMPVVQTDLARVEKLAEEIVEPSDPLILGWYYLSRNDVQTAEKWFKLSGDRAKSASASQGLALAMIAQSRFAEAERNIYEWRGSSDSARAVYMAAVANLLAQDPPVEIAPVVLQRMVPEVMLAKDANAAQQLGWYAYLLNQFETASGWFSTALKWEPEDEPSSYGLVLARQQMGDLTGVAQIQRRWAGRSERIARLGETRERRQPGDVPLAERFGTASQQSITSALPLNSGDPEKLLQPPSIADRVANTIAQTQAGKTTLPASPRKMAPETGQKTHAESKFARRSVAMGKRPPPSGCTKTIDAQMLSPERALPHGWCLMEMNRPLEAAAAFERALLNGSETARSDAAYGQSLAYLRAGLADKAAVAASKARQQQSRQVELEIALLSSRAAEAFNAGRMPETILALDQRARIAPERSDLMVLRGYAYMRLHRLSEALRVFEAVAATGNKEGLRGISAVNSVRKRDY